MYGVKTVFSAVLPPSLMVYFMKRDGGIETKTVADIEQSSQQGRYVFHHGHHVALDHSIGPLSIKEGPKKCLSFKEIFLN